MINRYRKRFILVTMLSLLVVLVFMMVLINTTNYIKTCKDSDNTIQSIKNSEGAFGPKDITPPDLPSDNPFRGSFDREERFRTRYFIITFDNSNDTIVNSNTENIALSNDQAIELAKTIISKNSLKGFYSDYRYNVYQDNMITQVFVLDCAKERQANYAFMLTSSIISLVAFAVVFLVMIVVSKIVVKPFYKNMEKQKQFITDASHELKTPLTIMSADVEVLEIESGENEWLNSIKSQISRLSSMTKNLTLMSKMDEDMATYELKDFNISSTLSEAIDDVTTLLSTKDKNLILNVENDIHINGNEELIRELFMILLENAYKYSLGDVNIALKKENKNVLIEFFNEAEVPNGNLNYIFDRFYRMDEARNSKTGGNGIGLSIAKTIVEINHGEINAIGNNSILTFIIKFKS